ncbi:hypothetical protein [Pseudosulfitobacter sp. SM2401]|uniref:hypothetical protein n=1 Tax=Pseudosulfitobacter sp. SM2401 TaxID=3350098 RepID=UPI0036F3E463
MEMIADILLVAGAVSAAFYCLVLGRRLKRFNSLEQGVGGAVAVLSAQVDDLNKSLNAAQATAAGSAKTLTELTARAEGMSKQLELQMASLHDIPTGPKVPEQRIEAAPVEPVSAPPPSETAQPMFVRHSSNGANQ